MADASSLAGGRKDGGRSRATAVVRLALAIWLMWTSGSILANTSAVSDARGVPVGVLLTAAGLYFTCGMFLLTGFMSRLTGLLLLGTALWEASAAGPGFLTWLYAAAGLYLALRGGGAWAMDVYVGKMQDRVREREERERAARANETAAPAAPAVPRPADGGALP